MENSYYEIGFTSVVGDLFHAGHVAMIQECKRHCAHLVVAVMADTHDREGKNKPVQSLFERFYQVANTAGVDECYACGSEEDLLLCIKTIKPEVRFVGDDYREKDYTDRDYCNKAGIRIMYTNRDHDLSSTELRRRVIAAETEGRAK